MKITKESVMALVAIFALVISAQFAFAQDSVSTESTSTEGISYGDDGAIDGAIDNLEGNAGVLSVAINQVQTLLTLNQEKKAELELKLADLRLVQAKVAAKNGNIEAMQKALEAHDRIIAKVQARIEKLDGAKDNAGIKKSITKLIGLQRAIEVHEARIEKLKDILADENLTEEQRVAVENKLQKAEQNTGVLKELQLAKKEQVKTKLRAVESKTEDEIESEVKSVESSEGLIEAQKLIAEKRIANTEEAIAKIKERLSEEKFNGIDTTIIDSKIASVEQTLSQAKELYAAGNYEEVIAILKPVNNYGRNMKVIVNQVRDARQEQNTERIKALMEEAQVKGTTSFESGREDKGVPYGDDGLIAKDSASTEDDD